MIPDQIRNVVCLTLALFFAVTLLHAQPETGPAGMTETPALIEITQVDLFSRKDWNGTRVSVLGFRLGMERKEVFINAQQQNLKLDDNLGRGCLHEAICNVFSASVYTGLVLTFGFKERVQAITVELPGWTKPRDGEKGFLVAQLLGQTGKLFMDYSDDLRIRLLGQPSTIWTDVPDRKASWGLPTNQELQYYSLGLILHVHWKNQPPGLGPRISKIIIDFTYPR